MHFLGNGVGNGAADAAAHYADLLEAVHLRGFAQRADKIAYIVALVHGVQHSGGAPGGLHHNGDGALLPVPTGDRHRDALALLIKAEDNKLAGLRVARDQRSLDLKQAYGLCLVQELLFNNFVH